MRFSVTPTCLLVLLVAVSLTTPLRADDDDCRREKRDLAECRTLEASMKEQKEAMEKKANATEAVGNKRREKFFDCQEKVDKDNLAWHNEKTELTARIATLDQKVKGLEEQLNAKEREL
ncbi:hypothetical protein CLOM_g4453 [Closterium sp. NIES-68]|nr:hypothetical protein CLOM_g4453 [Closterium sp. NIES-68]GJP77436.1 hypothetical protein CLOP_g7830 [Closterium sp. NIES-67]